MKFQNDRGGRIVLQDIKRPAKDEWGTGLDAMQAAMELEKAVNKALLDLHKVADKHSDFMVSLALSRNLVKWQAGSGMRQAVCDFSNVPVPRECKTSSLALTNLIVLFVQFLRAVFESCSLR